MAKPQDVVDEVLRCVAIGVRALRHIAEPVSAFLLLSGHEVLDPTRESTQEIRPRLLVLPFAASTHDPALGDLGEQTEKDHEHNCRHQKHGSRKQTDLA